MMLDFLCEHHRAMLTDDPDMASQLWLESQDRLLLVDGPVGSYHMNLAGSALDAAGIYVLAQKACNAYLIEQYTASALVLIEMLGEMRQAHMVIVVIAAATKVLDQVVERGGDSHAVEQSSCALMDAGKHATSPHIRRWAKRASNEHQPSIGATLAEPAVVALH